MRTTSTHTSQEKTSFILLRASLAVIVAIGAIACTDSTSTAAPSSALELQLPTTQFVVQLGLTAPVTSEEAQMIAMEATGGSVIDVTEEKEDGELIFEVRVQTPTERLEVEVRASDGAITEIEPDDG